MVLGEPLHHFFGVCSIQEGSPNSIQCFTQNVGAKGKNSLIRKVKGRCWVDPICLWGVGCGGGMIDSDRVMGVAWG